MMPHDSSSSASDNVRAAIISALQEEKESKVRRYGRAFLKAISVGGILSTLIYFCWSSSFDSTWMTACGMLTGFLAVAFLLYAYPQVRLSIRGYWSLSRLSLFFLLMTVVTGIQLILCPHFALVHLSDESPFRLFDHVTNFYMSLGGMNLCMFLCGLTFSSIGTAIASAPIARQFAFSKVKDLAFVALLGLVAQSPIAVLQLSNEITIQFFFFWLLGSATGILFVFFLFKKIQELRSVR